jgi:hypothetical protein
MEIGYSSGSPTNDGSNFVVSLLTGIKRILTPSGSNSRKRRIRRTVISSARPMREKTRRQINPADTLSCTDFEFINLKPRDRRSETTPDERRVKGEYRVRDRQEILRQAREMVDRKKSSARIKRALPITDGELSFVRQNLTLKNMARSK